MPFVCFIEIFRGRLSPGKDPDFSNSMVAVMVLSSMELLLPPWLSFPDFAADDWPSCLVLCVALLVVLSVPVGLLIVLMASLGIGLCGWALLALCSADPYWLTESSGRGDIVPRARSLRSVPSDTLVSLLFMDLFILARFDIGSREIVRAFGGRMSPMSTVSTRESFWSQLAVAAIEVGRVMVAVIMYDMVPRSNCRGGGQLLVSKRAEG